VSAHINETRREVAVPTLACDRDIVEVARAHSQDMCENDFFSHTGSDGRNPFERLRDGGVAFAVAAELIAHLGPEESPVDRWLRSDRHRENLLNEAFGRVGVGVATCGETYIYTAVFAD
jgi:uncharacterized protein YkwD